MPWVGRYLCPSPRLQVGLKNNNLIRRPRKGSYILAPHLVTLIVKVSQKSLGLPNSYTWSLLILSFELGLQKVKSNFYVKDLLSVSNYYFTGFSNDFSWLRERKRTLIIFPFRPYSSLEILHTFDILHSNFKDIANKHAISFQRCSLNDPMSDAEITWRRR